MRPQRTLLLAVALAVLAGNAETTAAEPSPQAIAAISYEQLPDDRGVEAPFAFALATVHDDYQAAIAAGDFTTLLDAWAPATDPDTRHRVESLLALLALGDLCRKPYEAQAPLIVQQRLRAVIPSDRLQALLATVILESDTVTVPSEIAAFDLRGFDAAVVRQRMVVYATKLLGRLRGYLPKQR